MGLVETLVATPLNNTFLQKLQSLIDWTPIEEALHTMYPARTGRPPCAPLVLFKMCLLQHCYGLSDPQCGEQVRDRLVLAEIRGLGDSGACAR